MTDRQGDYRALLKRSLDAIDRLETSLAAARQELVEVRRQDTEPIAILGMGCRFPGGCETPADYWELLRDGVDAVTDVPPDRWDVDAYFDPDPDAVGRTYTRWGGFLSNVDRFDAAFFGISPREAESLDPQQRLLLEVSWEALERAAIAPSSLAGSRTGVYVGMGSSDYVTLLCEHGGVEFGSAYLASGVSHSMAPGRISYFLGLHGPSLAIDTACSSSLVAMHNAIGHLRRREIDLALSGGVNLTLSPSGSILTSRARMMSFDGRCKTFDASADGYVRAEGCGMLVLKRLGDALRAKDPIVAVIRGSALNQDGRSSGLTAPNGAAQEMVIRAALANAGLTPAHVSVVEAHGTGTSLGDPIEVGALGRVFGQRDGAKPLLISSGKTNIGHSEGAAGIAGVIKAVLELQHKQVAPHLHLQTPNPLIPWDRLPFRVPRTLEAWDSPDDTPRRIGVSSFGFSGTNGHVVLEEAPRSDSAPSGDDVAPRLLVLSAPTAAALKAQAERLRAWLSVPRPASWRDIAFTAGHGRSHLSERLALVADEPGGAARALTAFLEGPAPALARGRAVSVPPEVAFQFTGQGAQFWGMGRDLYASQPAFRAALDACAAVVDPLLGRPLLDVMLHDESAGVLLDDTAFAQPALFALEYALTRLWQAWGVEPTVVVGHSVGEYVAACVAGVFSMADGITLVAHRGRLMSALPRIGSMAAVLADERRVRAALAGFEDTVSIGAINGPENVVISGRTPAVEAILATLAAEGVEAQRLNVSHAFHSPLMDPMLDEFERVASTMTFEPPRIGLISNVTGRMGGAEVATAGYWRRHVRDAVRFSDGVATLHAEEIGTCVEIGPSPVLTRLAQRCPRSADALWLTSLRRGMRDAEAMLGTLGQLYVGGHPVDWIGLAGEGAHAVSLPTYAFQREKYWHDLSRPCGGQRTAGTASGHQLLGDRLSSPVHIHQSAVSVSAMPWLGDHRLLGAALFPATGFLELAYAAAQRALGADDVALENVSFENRLDLPDDGAVTVQVVVTTDETGARRVGVHSAEAPRSAEAHEGWLLHATAAISAAEVHEAPVVGFEPGEELDVAQHYASLERVNAVYGPAFRGLRQMWRRGNTIVGRLELPEVSGVSNEGMILHPALLDACLHTAGVGLQWDSGAVPVGIDHFRVYRSGAHAIWSEVTIPPTSRDALGLRVDMTIRDDAGRLVAELRGLEFHRVPTGALDRNAIVSQRPEWLLEVDWQPAAMDLTVPPGARWLLLAGNGELAGRVAAHLRQRGDTVDVATDAAVSGEHRQDFRLDMGDAAQYRRLLTEAAGEGVSPYTGIVWLGAARTAPARPELDALQRGHREQIVRLLAALSAIGDGAVPLWLVTRGAQSVAGSMPNLLDAPLWGIGHVLASENPALRTVRIDLDPVEREDDGASLAAALVAADGFTRVAIRGGRRYVARLTQGVLESPEDVPRRLEIDQRGVLENLRWRDVVRTPPGPGEVEIRVLATGLNFRDVLNALGMYPGDPGPLGNECAGIITAVGDGVEGLSVGDEVVSMIDRSLATFAVAPAMLTVHKPSTLTFAAAATIPVAFLTAEYGLSRLARMTKGDRVLVHAATGGVGMAAMQLALRAGAEVFATAGSPAKRALAASLGAHHVSDSRSLAFVDAFRRATHGEGVDIVINSLAGEFIPASLGLLRRRGRFIEIGKTGIWDATAVSAAYPGTEYFPLYLGDVTAADPRAIRGLLQGLLADCASGVLAPLPQTIYPIERAEEAFRFMGQGKHTGKIVLTQRNRPVIRDDSTYLVTGGLGGLGLVTAEDLVDRGARHVVLVSRRPPSSAAEEAIERMRVAGAAVTVALGDVGTRADVSAILQRIEATLPPLRGIVHAAGIVDDGVLPEQDWSRFERVMGPKVAGTWHLHTLTRALPLEFFVMFSSGAALLGSPGQGNYAAANAFMDALAWVRESEGRPALSINWGTWAEVGMAAALGERHHRRWAEQGVRTIAPREGVRMLWDVLAGRRQPGLAILPLDRSRVAYAQDPFYEPLRPRGARTAKAAGPATDLLPRLGAASPMDRLPLVTAFLSQQLARVLAVDRSTAFRTDQPIMELGLDSLMAMELRNRVQHAVNVRLSVVDLMAGQSIEDVGARILEGLTPGSLRTEGSAAPEVEEGSL